ncbi:hypothetical protein Csa_023914, partial [Cucumis sativus]
SIVGDGGPMRRGFYPSRRSRKRRGGIWGKKKNGGENKWERE